MKKEMIIDQLKKNDINGDTEKSKLSSLLASKNRDYLLSPNGDQVNVSSLDGKIIGLYFSANWYMPCRSFNKVLVEVYEQIKQKGSNFEIVYVSSDEDIVAFDAYRATMPWLSVPFSDLDTKKALNRRFDVEGIPCLVILQPNDNKDGATMCDGVELVYRYRVGAFPFTRERVEELRREEREKHEKQNLTDLLTNHDRDYLLAHPGSKQIPVSSLAGKTVGLYFSAEWCIPCVSFTPKLIQTYHNIRQTNQEFEIVFISSDHDEASFESYSKTMPWPALPFGDPTVKSLVKHFDVKAIPTLVVLGPDGKTVTCNGRNLINLYQESCFPFTEARIDELARRLEEEAKRLPRRVRHLGHRHELSLVSDGNGGGPFICCQCDEQGSAWAYLCLECGYEVHPKCVTHG